MGSGHERPSRTPAGHALALPRAGGTYVLVLRLERGCVCRVGRLGEVAFPQGTYCYVGSAFGPGGLRARLQRHARPPGRCHWHVDYLRAVAEVARAWFLPGPRRHEHAWARALAASSALELAVPRFGASDCDCPGHLFRATGAGELEAPPRRVAPRCTGGTVKQRNAGCARAARPRRALPSGVVVCVGILVNGDGHSRRMPPCHNAAVERRGTREWFSVSLGGA
ncbi:GIY-YIG nuclease family protein [Aquisalimonas lutea]|uniref:GIY-YIG nuclease family protein n=1 Tax=Aquisalimonas lutea TaxID=1327750 RepID=UPI0025B50235|nr:GIY-YIG nuclease family protein [Aquisalimonas lutea]MDN3517735.1 GIY-YIG nuclease family protein [Aquisalimonas lutea]